MLTLTCTRIHNTHSRSYSHVLSLKAIRSRSYSHNPTPSYPLTFILTCTHPHVLTFTSTYTHTSSYSLTFILTRVLAPICSHSHSYSHQVTLTGSHLGSYINSHPYVVLMFIQKSTLAHRCSLTFILTCIQTHRCSRSYSRQLSHRCSLTFIVDATHTHRYSLTFILASTHTHSHQLKLILNEETALEEDETRGHKHSGVFVSSRLVLL